MIKENEIAFTEEMTRVKRFDLLSFEKTYEYKKNDKSQEKLKFSPRDNCHVIDR